MTEPLPLTLKWRRSWPDSDQFFEAYDPERCGEALVAQVSRNRTPTGEPTDWDWSLLAPGHVASDFQRSGRGRGNAPDPRSAAHAAEEAYFRFVDEIDPDVFARALRQEEIAIYGASWRKKP